MNKNNYLDLNNLRNIGIDYQKKLDNTLRKKLGIYYTPLDLTDKIIEKVLETKFEKPIWEIKVLEPCVGIGNFIFSYLKYVHEHFELSRMQAEELINNVYVCDVDEEALELYFQTLTIIAKQYFDVTISDNYRQNIGNALIFDLSNQNIEYIPLNHYFGDIKFDVIMTNPPYKSLRAEKRHYDTVEEYTLDQLKYAQIKELVKKEFQIAGTSSPNIFKYFIEKVLKEYSGKDSVIALLIPTSILTDKSCEGLRTEILTNNSLRHVMNIPERNAYIDAAQAMTTIVLEKGKQTLNINIQSNIDNDESTTVIDAKKAVAHSQGNAILVLNEEEYFVLDKMKNFPKLKELDFIVNMRGELDISLNKEHIILEKTPFPLLRGRNIKYYHIEKSEKEEFVSENFVLQSSKQKYIKQERIICQQIVNMSKEHRLMFSFIPSGFVLGNSCNFITVESNNRDVDIYYILGLLNSKQLNWYFKLFSSNNHINNYELDNLPIPLNNKYLQNSISSKVKEILNNYDEKLIEAIEEDVRSLFGMDYEKKGNSEIGKAVKEDIEILSLKENLTDFEKKALEGRIEKERCLSNQFVMNNTTYKLSELDLEMISSVPPGGNWTDIPQETMNKSKRLLGIQKTGGRTTLYGRMDYNKPSYTITTYFNRPGNGSYIHPSHERVITPREAARLQGFKDDYLFIGNQKDILNQIGNAVPPLIGYLLGKLLKEKLNVKKSLDLFSGAGGLLTGIQEAGIEHVLANDIDKSACATLKLNHPMINVICSDVTKQETKDYMVAVSKEEHVDLICGGPPCQGFSLAGYRDEEDPRNQLFKDFLYLVEKINPKAFVFENVVGLLSSRKGQTYIEIKELFSSLGYKLHGETLDFSEYGVPQKRRRVIIIGVRKDLDINPTELFPTTYTVEEEQKITIREAIKDLDSLEHKEDEMIKSDYTSSYIQLMRNEIDLESYYENLEPSFIKEDVVFEQMVLSF